MAGRNCIMRTLAGLALALVALAAQAPKPRSPAKPRPELAAKFAHLPLAFEPGTQHDFLARGPGFTVTLRSQEAELELGKGSRFRLMLDGARTVVPQGAQRQASVSNEYIGSDRRRWRTRIPNYGEVDFRQVYPGIGLRYHGEQGQLEADFLVAGGADPSRIRFSFPDSGKLRLGPAGELRVGAVTLGRPDAYQTIRGRRRRVSATYALQGTHVVIRLGAYDHSRELVIDPTLSYSYDAPGGYSTLTGLGRAFGLFVDASGDPVLIASAGDTCGDVRDALDMYCTVAIWKFNPQGTQVLWRSSIAGPGGEYEFASGTDPNGDIFIGGSTDAPTGFPTTEGVVQETPSGPGIRSYAAKFGPDGTLLYSTLLGTGDMELYTVTGDANGDAYVAGSDKVSDLDVPPINSLPAPCGGSLGSCYSGFVEELNPTATDYLYGTYFGGPGLTGGSNDAPYYLIIGTIAVDNQGHIYIGGENDGYPDLPTVNAFEPSCQPNQANFCLTGFIAELDPTVGGPNGVVFADYLLGQPSALLLDNASPQNLYVAGAGGSDPAFTTQHALGLSNSIYVAKIPTATPAQPAFQTLFDGSGGNSDTELGGVGLALDSGGDIWVGGATSSGGTPPAFGLMNPISFTCPSGTQSQPYCATGFVSEASPDGASLLFSTYLGGDSTNPGDVVASVATDASGNTYAAGTAYSSNFPVTPNAYYSTCCGAFLAKLAPQPAPTAPTVAINPGSLGTTFVGVETTTQIVVTNTATSGPALVIGDVTYTDPSFDYEVYPDIGGSDGNPSCYYYETNTPDPVPPGGSCDISVYWYPELTTPDPLTVSIFDDAANILIPQVLNYNPTAYNGPQATVAPVTPIGSVLQGSEGVATVTVTSTGNEPLTINGFSLSGSADFTLGTAPPTACTVNLVLYRGGTCNIAVVYTANGAPNIAENTTLSILDNASSVPPISPQTVHLTAATTPPEAKISSNLSSLQFPTTVEGEPSETLSISFQNVGTAPLNIGSVGSEGTEYADFRVQSNCVAQSPLQVYNSCTASVYFQPSTVGPEGANLEVVSNDPLTPVLLIPLTGTGGPGQGAFTSLPFLVSLDNEAPPQPSTNGAGASAVSSGGQFVAFTAGGGYSSGPTNNLPGPTPAVQGTAGLYLRNSCNGPDAGPNCIQSTQFVAYGPTSGPYGNGGAACVNQQETITEGATNPRISGDGRFVAFNDDACPVNNTNGSQLEPGPVYLRDTQANGGAGATTVVSDASGNALSSAFEMSEDARFFAYLNYPVSGGQPEVTETDTCQSDGASVCTTPQDVLVSQSNNGTPDGSSTDGLTPPALSHDGRYVVFASDWDDVNGVSGNGNTQVYLRDTCLGVPAGAACSPATILVSQVGGAPGAGGNSGYPYNLNGKTFSGVAVSEGGRYVVFTSNATNLPQPANGNGTHPQEVYLRDTVAGTTTLISVTANGSTPSGSALQPHISDDGRIITFVDTGALIAGAPGNGFQGAVYNYDTCTSNGTPVSGCTTPGLQGVVSQQTLAGGGTQDVVVSDSELDGSGALAAFTGPPYNCSTCTQVWLNRASSVIVPTPPSITTTSLPNGVAGQAYPATTIATSGGVGAVTVSQSGGTLPPGLGIAGNAVAGTPTTSDTYTFSLIATDSTNAVSAPQSYTVTIACPNIAVGATYVVQVAGVTPPSVPTTLNLTAGALIPAVQFLAVLPLNTNLPVVFSESGSLDGLTFDPATAQLSGTPASAGSFPFTVSVTGGGCTSTSVTYTLVVAPPQSIALPVINETIHTTDSIGTPNTLISATVLQPIQETVHTSDSIGSPNTLISATVLQPIQETVHTSDSIGSPNTLISATVLQPIQETVHTTDSLSPAPVVCAVPASVSIKLGGYLRHFGTPLYSQAVTLTNTSGSAITGPIYYVVGSLSGATAYQPSGVTDSCAPPAGTPYITVSGPLAAGASVQIVIYFTNVTAIHYTPSVLTGGTP